MPFYQKRGEIPNKRHIQFRDKNKNLYYEELISRQGFSSLYSNEFKSLSNAKLYLKTILSLKELFTDPKIFDCFLFSVVF